MDIWYGGSPSDAPRHVPRPDTAAFRRGEAGYELAAFWADFATPGAP
ncbi:MAG: hypothetical protein H6734_14220 [Alphaproteobacteria bacterium]|nr:hypothetical protein [Alphaproteobacteria bacterium]